MNDELGSSIVDDGGRQAVLLQNGLVRAVIDSQGGMMPEFSLRRGAGWLNVHYLPHFRGNGTPRWNESRHSPFWKAELLYHLAGDFPCTPNFGGGCTVDGVQLPPHGPTASGAWKLVGHGKDKKLGVAWARFSLDMRSKALPLSFKKYDVIIDGHLAFYSLLRIINRGSKPLAINLGRHATIGAPFLQAGCLISASAKRYMAAPAGTEFDATGRLAGGVEFSDLKAAPLRQGGTVDISVVPGPIGATDLVTGAIPSDARLGWTGVVNPALDLAYLNYFPGPAALRADEVAPAFNILWMQYGGRPFTPWAAREGGTDNAYCLGVEQATSAYANGLAYSRAHPELLGAPTTVTIPARSEKIFRYGSLVAEANGALRGPVQRLEPTGDGLVLHGSRSFIAVRADSGFERLLIAAERADRDQDSWI